MLNFKNKSGVDIYPATDPMASLREISVQNLGKGETKPLSGGLEEGGAVKLLMSLDRTVEDFDVHWDKENSAYEFRPVFVLTTPAQNKTLTFEDESIAIDLAVGNEQLEFTLRNKTQEPQTINWDEVSFVDLSGTAHRVLHQGVKLVDRDKPQSPTVIPPGAKISDLVEPSDSVEYNTVLSDWIHDPLLPQDMVKFKGKTFGIFMPIVVNGKKKNYTFTIRIDDVQL